MEDNKFNGIPLPGEQDKKQQTTQSVLENPFKQVEMINLDETREQLAKCLVTSKTEVPPSKPIIAVDDVGIFTKSDIHLVKAKAKAGKTTMLKIIVAAIMLGNLFRLKSLLDNPKIVWFDTEQSMSDTHRIVEDITKMSGKSPDEIDEHIKVYHLRRFFSDELKTMFISALVEHKPDAIIVDGVVDFVESFNDEKESKRFIRALITLSEQYDCSIINVLHTNKAQEDHNPRGHLGSFATNASETVLECEENGGIFSVKSTETRHARMPKWHFIYDSKDNIVSADELRNHLDKLKDEQKEAAKAEADAKLAAEMLNIINKNGGRMKRSTLKDEMVESMAICKTKAYEIINGQIGKTIFVDGDCVQVSQQTSLQFEST